MACGRALDLLNKQNGISIGEALSVSKEFNVKKLNNYNILTAHKEMLLAFDDAEMNAFINTFGMEISNLLHGCEVHFYTQQCEWPER